MRGKKEGESALPQPCQLDRHCKAARGVYKLPKWLILDPLFESEIAIKWQFGKKWQFS